MNKFNLNYIKTFVLKQKCMPWRIYLRYCNLRNFFCNINTQRHWDEVWNKERSNPSQFRSYPTAFEQICSMVPFNSKVVDIGCGIGILLEKLKNEKKCDVFGVDISKEAINTIKHKNIDGLVAKVPPIPLPPNFFDIVIATELLEHLNNPYSALKEIIRILKPKGFFIITVPENALDPHAEREHVRSYDANKLKKILIKTEGIKAVSIIQVKEQAEHFYRLIAKGQKCQELA